MLPTFGFSKEQIEQLHETLGQAATALKNCREACQQRSQKFRTEFGEWFGEAPNEANEPSVKQLIHIVDQMYERLHNSSEHLHLKFCDDPLTMKGDQAYVDSFNARHGRFNVKDEIDSYYNWGNNAEIRIAPSFFDQGDVSEHYVSRLMIFLHELSHWAAGTKDMYKYSRDERPYIPEEDRETKCYGATDGTQWAKVRGKYKDGIIKAIWNADNVGFFVTQFYFPG